MTEQSNEAPLMLGISGMRGLVDRSLTPSIVARYAMAFGRWLQDRCPGQPAPQVLLGRDSRPSGQRFEAAAVTGLMAAGCFVRRLGVVSTPGVAAMIRQRGADGGLVITASHNPSSWNGVKLMLRDGVAPSPALAAEVIDCFGAGSEIDFNEAAPVSVDNDNETVAVHCDAVRTCVDVESIRRARLTVVVDSVHGAGGPETQTLLKDLGVFAVHLYPEPSGQFPHTPEPTKENLTGLCDAVRQHEADLGFAQDPDADRLAIVDGQGRYIGEEYTLALCALHRLQRGEVTVANLSTSRMIDDIAAMVGATVHRTPVGEAHVAAEMARCGATIGGEGNGGVILSSISYVRDSLVGISLMLEMLAQRRVCLDQIVGTLPCYAMVKDKMPFKSHMVDGMAQSMRRQFPGEPFDEQDGVRVDLADRWVHVRASNTEPIVRLIGEAPDLAQAAALIEQTKLALLSD